MCEHRLSGSSIEERATGCQKSGNCHTERVVVVESFTGLCDACQWRRRKLCRGWVPVWLVDLAAAATGNVRLCL